jgi:hypothetical protein
MDYVRDLDEMLMPPPFRLGSDAPPYRIQGHSFVIPADAATLQRMLNEQLNLPLGATANDPADPWDLSFGAARQRTTGGVSQPRGIKYVVLKNLYGVVLNVLRYWRVDAEQEPEKGYMAYTEVILQFLVHRVLENEEEAPAESFYFLAVVYIDDSAYRGELQDPHSLPILIGREAFGLPKNPGQIYYCPDDAKNAPGPRLNIWDYNPLMVEKLALEPAITVNPSSWTEPPPPCTPVDPAVSAGRSRYGPLAAQLAVKEEDLRLRPLDAPRDPFAAAARVLTLPRLDVVSEVVIREDLLLFARLVGLKQFPDPTSTVSPAPASTVKACYQAVVESAVEYTETDAPQTYAVVGDQEIEFHPRSRVDLAGELGIELDANRRVQIPDWNAYYMVSNFVYGRPLRTDVWEPA